MAWVAGDHEVGSHCPLANQEASGKESLASALPIPSNNIRHRTQVLNASHTHQPHKLASDKFHLHTCTRRLNNAQLPFCKTNNISGLCKVK